MEVLVSLQSKRVFYFKCFASSESFSVVRVSLLASVSMIFIAMSGCSEMSSAISEHSYLRTVVSARVRMLAVRCLPLAKATSPKIEPGYMTTFNSVLSI